MDENEIETEVKEEVPTNSDTPNDTPPEPEAAPEPGEPSSSDPFNSIAGSLTAAKPEKQDFYVKAVEEKAEAAEIAETLGETKDFRFLKDKSGRYWDGSICSNKVDPKTGIPEKTASGLWSLNRSARSADRKKLPKRPPNIEQKVENEQAEAQAQAEARAAADAIMTRSVGYAAGIMKAYKAGLSKMSGEKAVDDILGLEFGEGKHKVKVEDIVSGSLLQVMVKRGGGPELSPEMTLLGSAVLVTGAVYLHPSKPERRQTLKERAGLFLHRIKNRKRINASRDEPTEGGE